MAFVYNSHYKGDSLAQYKQFLQNQEYVRQIINAVDNAADKTVVANELAASEITEAINICSENGVKLMQESTEAIKLSVIRGFEDLIQTTQSVEYSLDAFRNSVDHRFSQILDSIEITNRYLGNISHLLRIPDQQKQRAYYIEEGLKFYGTAIQASKDEYYEVALTSFERAIDIEPNDFFSLYYVGLIHLYNVKFLDLQKAEILFRKSATMYFAEGFVGGTITSKTLLPSQDFTHNCARSYYLASLACYLQKKYYDAVALAREAVRIDPSYNSARFMLAKYQLLNGDLVASLDSLKTVIDANAKYFDEAYADLDLCQNENVISFLVDIYSQIQDKSRLVMQEIDDIAIEETNAHLLISHIRFLFSSKNYFDIRKGLDLRNSNGTWVIETGATIGHDGSVMPEIKKQTFTGSLIDFIKFERLSTSAVVLAQWLVYRDQLLPVRQNCEDQIAKEKKAIKDDTVPTILVLLVGAILLVLIGLWLNTSDWGIIRVIRYLAYVAAIGAGALALLFLFFLLIAKIGIANLEKNLAATGKKIREANSKIWSLRSSLHS